MAPFGSMAAVAPPAPVAAIVNGLSSGCGSPLIGVAGLPTVVAARTL
jgi:hypothetical protein